MTERLTSAVLVSALVRAINAQGGFATVLAKGEEGAGAILLIHTEKGEILGFRERLFTPLGRYEWAATGPQNIENRDELSQYLVRRQSKDPDLWLVELDIADSTQLTAVLAAIG